LDTARGAADPKDPSGALIMMDADMMRMKSAIEYRIDGWRWI
jgi:hypothetical protein